MCENSIPPIRRQAAEALTRARKLPIGHDRNELRQLALGLRWLEKRGYVAIPEELHQNGPKTEPPKARRAQPIALPACTGRRAVTGDRDTIESDRAGCQIRSRFLAYSPHAEPVPAGGTRILQPGFLAGSTKVRHVESGCPKEEVSTA